jgi:hypothetical protein
VPGSSAVVMTVSLLTRTDFDTHAWRSPLSTRLGVAWGRTTRSIV